MPKIVEDGKPASGTSRAGPMIVIPDDTPFCYVGIDPGASGGLACVKVAANGVILEVLVESLGNSTDQQVWDWLMKCRANGMYQCFAMIEQQVPRPTKWFDKRTKKWMSSILRSTCLLYGSYCRLDGMLTASRIPHESVAPQRWQKGLQISSRGEGEAEGDWKRRLKAKAQSLYPSVKVTAAVADALLLASYCRKENLRSHGRAE